MRKSKRIYSSTKDIRNLVKGSIVWRVKSKYREAPSRDEYPHTEIYIIDALTGKVIGVEREYIDWG